MKQVDGVDDLIFRNLKREIYFRFLHTSRPEMTPTRCQVGKTNKSYQQIDHPEVLLQAVTHKANSRVDEETQLQVRRLECGQMLRRNLCIQVSRFDARILRQVIDHLEAVLKITLCVCLTISP